MANPLQGMTFQRTIIVGLGSTGLDVLHAFQDYWYERFNNTDSSLIKLINIETDSGNKVQSKPSGTMIDQILIKNGGLSYNDLANDLRQNYSPYKIENLSQDWKWTNNINWNNLGVLQDAGAGGVRAGGRMLLYAKNSDNRRNSELFQDTIRHVRDNDFVPIASTNDSNSKAIFEKLGYSLDMWVDNDPKSIDPVDKIQKSIHNPHFEGDRVNAIVVGSLTGGTSSGMFIDVAYFLQDFLNITPNELNRIHGVFIIPPHEEATLSTRSGGISWNQVRANAFGSMYDIARLKNQFFQTKNITMPYGYVYFVAPEYNIQTQFDYFEKLHGLTDMVALRLFLDMIGYQHEFNRQITDEVTQNPLTYSFTMGTGAILYPKYTMAERGACELSGRLCDVLVDDKNTTDTSGRKNPIQRSSIKRDVEQRIIPLFQKHIYDQLKRTPGSAESSIEERIEYWTNELPQNIKKNKKSLKSDFDDADGLFRETMEANKDEMVKGLLNDIEGEIIHDFHNNFNLVWIGLKIEYYIEGLKGVRDLWDRQGCHSFNSIDEITKILEEYLNYGSVKAPTDLDKILRDLLGNLFDQYLVSNAYRYMEDVFDALESWRKNLNAAVAGLKNAKNDFQDRYKSLKARLENNEKISPVVKIFHKDERSDYRQIIENLIGKRVTPGWDHLGKGGIDSETVWKKIKVRGIVDTENIRNVLLKDLHTGIASYLNDVEFNILDKALLPGNRQVVSTILKKIKSGFLKYKLENNETLGRVPSSIVANAEPEKIEEFFREYAMERECQAIKNPILEHMIVYTKDITGFLFEDIASFDKMKKSFLLESSSQPEWTKLRLAYSSEVDFAIMEEKKTLDIEALLKFINYFWFVKTIQPNGIEQYNQASVDGISYPVAELDPSGNPKSDGINIKKALEPFIFLIDPASKQTFYLNMANIERKDISAICAERPVYWAIKNMMIPHLNWEKDDFLDALYRHYDSLFGIVKKGMDKYETIFSDGYKVGKKLTIKDIENQNCLISTVYKILSR